MRGRTNSESKPHTTRGIRSKNAGSTWCGQRWIEAIQNLIGAESERLVQGRSSARAGRVHDLVIRDGEVRGKVTGTQFIPYKITIKLSQLSEAAWKTAIAGMVEKAQFAAALIAGEVPEEIDEVFCFAQTSLFPLKVEDLTTSCSCPDEDEPCEHVAATHYVLGEALDRDPFLLFELRGRTKRQILDALREARELVPARPARVEPEIPRVNLGKLTAAEYDRPRDKLPVLHFSFDEAVTHGAVLRQLGKPAAWKSETSPAELLAPIVRAAAERARSIAMAEPESVDATEDMPNPAGNEEKSGSGS